MATTSPDNLYSPNSGNQYALVQDLGEMQNSTQRALVARANMYVGTTAQRQAFTNAPEGVHWQDTNGNALEWVRRNGSWAITAPIVSSGVVTANVVDNSLVNVNVTFPASRFTEPPRVLLTSMSPAGATTTLNYRVFSISTSGCTIQVGRNPAGSVDLQWVAIQHP